MIFPVNLKVLSQMLDPAGQKCDLHIRAASIFVMQLELLEIRRLVALSHNEEPIVDEDAIFATTQRGQAPRDCFLSRMLFPFTVVPEMELRPGTHAARSAEDNAKEIPKKLFRRIHAQFSPGCDNWFA